MFNIEKTISLIVLMTLSLSSQIAFSGDFEIKLVNAAFERTKQAVRYDGRYLSIPYPNGDVPSNIGVCTDVIIRAYRAIGTDLQKLVHEDMAANFNAYPSANMGA